MENEKIDRIIAGFEERTAQARVIFKELKDQGRKVVGLYCSYVPRELVWAAGAVPVGLCGSREQAFDVAEQDLPRNFCPLIKASYGMAVSGAWPVLRFRYYRDVDEKGKQGKWASFPEISGIFRITRQLRENTEENSHSHFGVALVRSAERSGIF